MFFEFHFSYVTHHVGNVSLILEKRISFDGGDLEFPSTSDFEIFEEFEFLQCSHSFKNSVFRILKMVFDYMNFRNRKSILFDIGKLAFMISVDLKIFEHFHFLSFFHQKNLSKNCFRKSFAIFWSANNYFNENYESYLLEFLFTTDFGIFEEFNFYNVHIFFKNSVFRILKMIFQSYEFVATGSRYYLISRSSH